jgi:signal transduction histidine kinase
VAIGGAALVAAVAIGLAHERRLARRIADRSAELERLSAELIRVNRAKSEFLANVSHELRTPLNAIVGFVEMLHDGVYGELPPRQVVPVQRIASSATHLRHLVDQILDLAKIAAGRLEVHADPVDLRPFVLDVATEIEPLVAEKGLALSLGIPATLPKVDTDPTHLRQILVNLLGNAVKFTPQGRIAVRATLRRPRGAAGGDARRPRRPPAARAAPRLAPSARAARARAPATRRYWDRRPGRRHRRVGIAPSDCERIFDEFEQVGPRAGDSAHAWHRARPRHLPPPRPAARRRPHVDSAPAKGSTFTLWLPVARSRRDRCGRDAVREAVTPGSDGEGELRDAGLRSPRSIDHAVPITP